MTERLVFHPVKTGTFRLMCAEYCGTRHSAMTGKVVVMEPQDFATWLAAQPEGDDLAERGEALYTTLGCAGCHAQTGTVRAPELRGIYGRPVPLSDGRIVTADDRYLRDSILEPRRDIVAGFRPIMPSFAGRVGEGDLLALLAWLRSNGEEEQANP
jgi:cytochrome c oxidase subunit 2